jgi:hypothetical protein
MQAVMADAVDDSDIMRPSLHDLSDLVDSYLVTFISIVKLTEFAGRGLCYLVLMPHKIHETAIFASLICQTTGLSYQPVDTIKLSGEQEHVTTKTQLYPALAG